MLKKQAVKQFVPVVFLEAICKSGPIGLQKIAQQPSQELVFVLDGGWSAQ